MDSLTLADVGEITVSAITPLSPSLKGDDVEVDFEKLNNTQIPV